MRVVFTIIAIILFITSSTALILFYKRGDWISDNVIYISNYYTPWSKVSGLEWRQHFSKGNSILVLKLIHDKYPNLERYIVIPNKYKDEIEAQIRSQLARLSKTVQ